MNQIKILELNLRNFKGIKDLKLTPEGNNFNISGENGTGKTTIMDAFLWLLFDKDSSNSSNFNIKTLDKLGAPIHMLEHEVIANLEIAGKKVELQKLYTEKWTKKRGQADSELTGHTTDHFINGVPKKKSEYAAYLNNIIDENTFRILTNPLHFNVNLNWKDRRNIVMDLEKDIGPAEIFKENRDLKPLEELLEDKSIDDLKAEMASRRKKLNEELKSIPYRIDELSREDLEIDVSALNKEKKELEKELSDVKNTKGPDYEFRIRAIKGSITALENEIKDLQRSLTEKLRTELDTVRKDMSKIDGSYYTNKSNISKIEAEIKGFQANDIRLKAELEELRGKFEDIKVSEFNQASTICPTCNQSLQADKISDLVNQFESKKADSMKEINSLGKEKTETLKINYDFLNIQLDQLEEAQKEFKLIEELLLGKREEIYNLEHQLSDIDVTTTKEYKEIQEKIKQLSEDKSKVEEAQKNQFNTSGLINKFESQIADINKDLAKIDLVAQNKIRVEQLMARETELAQMVADAEGIEFLCDQYVITKSSLLENKLNSKFSLVKFKLFDVQVNGGINETFVTTVDGVPFEDLNNAARINAGLDIIRTLSEQYEFIAPIFIDNRESVNKIIDIENQVINLIVSKDKKLKMEVEK